MSRGTHTHPPEELLEVLVLASNELSPELLEAITSHARNCALCRSVLGLLLQFHKNLEMEEGSPIHADALVRAVFSEVDPPPDGERRKRSEKSEA